MGVDEHDPCVTVYIPTRNRGALVDRAIRSVLDQDYPNIELIIVDDCSDDGGAAVEHWAAEGKIRLFRNDFQMGACISRNIAICNASGEFITGLDDDDCFGPGRIRALVEQWKLLERTGADFGFLFDSARRWTDSGESIVNTGEIAGLEDLLRANVVGSQVFTQKERLRDAGLFAPELPAWQDWDLWVRLCRRWGPGVSIQKASYIMDEVHGGERISVKPEFVIRFAHQLFLHRNGPFSVSQKASVRLCLLNYTQVAPTLTDLWAMAPLLFSWRHFWVKAFRRVWQRAVPRCEYG
jgi:glycosyltransferase involved in cell wall biosynthesis